MPTTPPKTLTLFLTTPPFGFENTLTVLRLADAALAQGYRANLFASADAVYAFARDQKASGVPDPVKGFSALIERGLHVELCGSCLTLRGLGKTAVLEGSAASSMKRLFGLMQASDVFVTLGS
jgi:sulfur relay (sulfurtransferase) complex TusBCD TusD component (DsrE family)